MKFKVISIEDPTIASNGHRRSFRIEIPGLKLCDKLQSTIVPTFSLEPCNHSKLNKRNKTEEIGQQPQTFASRNYNIIDLRLSSEDKTFRMTQSFNKFNEYSLFFLCCVSRSYKRKWSYVLNRHSYRSELCLRQSSRFPESRISNPWKFAAYYHNFLNHENEEVDHN